MTKRLSSRLEEARRSVFVGRNAEVALLHQALTSSQPPFFVLFIHGPGGVGKSTLLREYVHVCAHEDATVVTLDARNMEPSPPAFYASLREALGLAEETQPEDAMAANEGPLVLIIDTYELLTPLDPWVRDSFLPYLPENVLVILAGRHPPSPDWLSDAGWQTLLRTLSLRNLSPDETRDFMQRRHIPAEQYEPVMQFTHGHPLALSLIADVYAQRPDYVFQAEDRPDVVRMLLEKLVQKLPGPAHRAALEACALVRVTNEALLAEMLALPDTDEAKQTAYELFHWLRSLSFIDVRRSGVYPHDLARDALVSDLRWRNPDWYATLHARARAYYTRRLEEASGVAEQRALFDLIYLHRDNAAVRPFFEWQTSGGAIADAMQPQDEAALRAAIARHEGETSARLATHWFHRQPQGVQVWRDQEGNLVGMLVTLDMGGFTAEDRQKDPAAQSTWAYLQKHAPLRKGERASLFRFWLAIDQYQDVSPVQSLIFISIVRHYLTTPALAFTFFPAADPEFWHTVLSYANLRRLEEADFEMEGRRFGIYGHDWRAMPPANWLALLAEREIAMGGATPPPAAPAETLVVLSREAFDQALLKALRAFNRSHLLADNPLLNSRLVLGDGSLDLDEEERIQRLYNRLQEASQRLQAAPRTEKLYRALDRTYFRPAPTQEAAAELLGLPFSTYRRHLKAGIAELGKLLWAWEVTGGVK